jgi:hypothetical protein
MIELIYGYIRFIDLVYFGWTLQKHVCGRTNGTMHTLTSQCAIGASQLRCPVVGARARTFATAHP